MTAIFVKFVLSLFSGVANKPERHIVSSTNVKRRPNTEKNIADYSGSTMQMN